MLRHSGYYFRRVLLSLTLGCLAAWFLTILLVGRAVPWQATRSWATAFAIFSLVFYICWWFYWRRIEKLANDLQDWLTASLWSAIPFSIITLTVVVLAYLSDSFNEKLHWPYWHMPIVAASIVFFIFLETTATASLLWLADKNTNPFDSLRVAVSKRSTLIMWGSLLVIGILQGAASTSPIGDDIGKYTEAAIAILHKEPYPVHQAASYLIEAGMTANSPAMPVLPILLALSFAILGQTVFGLVVPLAALAAIFPLSFYLACKYVTESKVAAYITAILLTLFPVYQIHVLGTPVPDTLFVVLLLFVAAFAATAITTTNWLLWISLGVTTGLVANARPEGITFSIAIIFTLMIFNYSRKQFWACVLAYLLTLAPFAAIYFFLSGSLWPTTFGGTINLYHLDANINLFYYFSLPWYIQAFGIELPALVFIAFGMFLGVVAGMIRLWKRKPSLIFIPLLGMGYILSSLFLHPLILMSYTPVDALRHWSSGIPYIVLTLSYCLHSCYFSIHHKLPISLQRVLMVVSIVVLCSGIWYETERLARPEPYFEGKSSLLWTSSSYLLTDLARNAVPLPAIDDPRSGEEIRDEFKARFKELDLKHVNRSEPYHWTTMIVALFGLVYILFPITSQSIGQHGEKLSNY